MVGHPRGLANIVLALLLLFAPSYLPGAVQVPTAHSEIGASLTPRALLAVASEADGTIEDQSQRERPPLATLALVPRYTAFSELGGGQVDRLDRSTTGDRLWVELLRRRARVSDPSDSH